MSSPWRTTQIVTGFRWVPSRLRDAMSSSSASPIVSSSSLVHALMGVLLLSSAGLSAAGELFKSFRIAVALHLHRRLLSSRCCCQARELPRADLAFGGRRLTEYDAIWRDLRGSRQAPCRV